MPVQKFTPLDISYGKSDHIGEEAIRIYKGLLSNKNNHFHYSGEVKEGNLTFNLATVYMNNFAYNLFLANHQYTRFPLFIARFTTQDELATVSMGVWSNGCIINILGEDISVLNLYIDPETVKTFGLPTPEELDNFSPELGWDSKHRN